MPRLLVESGRAVTTTSNAAPDAGQSIRLWLYLLSNCILGSTYFTFLVAGFALGIGLSVILIGVPILRFMMRASRAMVGFDRQWNAVLLGTTPPANANNLTTAQSLGYLFARFVIGILSINLASFILPFMIIELILMLAGNAGTGNITGRILQAAVAGIHHFSENVIGIVVSETPEKPKRDFQEKRRVVEMDEEPQYALGDDGELIERRPAVSKRKNG